MNIYTAGYSTHKPAELKSVAERLNAIVFDIRYSPRSRIPGWNAENLLQLLGVHYFAVPEWGNRNYLGTFGKGIMLTNFDAGLCVLQRWQKCGGGDVILLCACKEASGCHRTLIADKLKTLGYSVEEMKW